MKFVSNRETYANIATLYFMGNMSQDEIAAAYNISRFKVSRILKKCREQNIVEVRINNQPKYYKHIEDQLCALLHIDYVHLVSPSVTHEGTKANVGKAAAQYLEDNLVDGMKVGFSWGSTVQAIFREYSPPKIYSNCTFVQLTGSICSHSIVNEGYMDGCDIVQKLADKAGARWSVFQVPYIVKTKALSAMLLEEPNIKQHVEWFEQLDMAIIGVGSNIPHKSIPYTSGYITLEESKQLIDSGFVADISGSHVDIDGNERPYLLTDRVLSIPLPTLKKVPDVVALAAGVDKVYSLIGGARGKYYNKLILDEITALSIIDYFTPKEAEPIES
ncbi:MAG: sugar-binding domain-containing protein [Eubacteriales bacterium]|nr:sugar-binding domain-containing protein [Eubacteriales bacterium]